MFDSQDRGVDWAFLVGSGEGARSKNRREGRSKLQRIGHQDGIVSRAAILIRKEFPGCVRHGEQGVVGWNDCFQLVPVEADMLEEDDRAMLRDNAG